MPQNAIPAQAVRSRLTGDLKDESIRAISRIRKHCAKNTSRRIGSRANHSAGPALTDQQIAWQCRRVDQDVLAALAQ